MMYVTINEVVKKALITKLVKDDNLGEVIEYWDGCTEARTAKGERIRLVIDSGAILLYVLRQEDWYIHDEYEEEDLIDYLCELVLELSTKEKYSLNVK